MCWHPCTARNILSDQCIEEEEDGEEEDEGGEEKEEEKEDKEEEEDEEKTVLAYYNIADSYYMNKSVTHSISSDRVDSMIHSEVHFGIKLILYHATVPHYTTVR